MYKLGFYLSDTLHPKRRRTTTAKTWDVDSEQEEHSLSLSHSSSPSLSDQEQTATQKAADSATGSQGFHLFQKLNEIPSNDKSHSTSNKQKESINAVQRTPNDLHLLGECHSLPSSNMSRNSMQFSGQKLLDAGPVQNAVNCTILSFVILFISFAILVIVRIHFEMLCFVHRLVLRFEAK